MKKVLENQGLKSSGGERGTDPQFPKSPIKSST
jgi:hypothetical protein